MVAKSLIFVTGASGFIGSQVVIDALKAGHTVRVNVRRESQIDQLKSRFAPAASTPSQLEFVVNPDLSDSNAIRKSLDNVDYIFHIASPMPGGGDDFKTEYLHPAVNGTEAILEAAYPVRSVKRVVITSSVLGIMPIGALEIPAFVLKEGANPAIPVSVDMPFPPGPEGNLPKYSASKILAHRATLDWVKSRNPDFDLVTIHPTFVVGYDHTVNPAYATQNPLSIGGSGKVNEWILESLASGTPVIPGPFVDNRDVSKAHLGALDAPLEGKGRDVTEVLLVGPKERNNWETAVRAVKDWSVKNADVEVVNKLTDEEGTYPHPFVVEDKSRVRALEQFGIGEWVSVEEMIWGLLDQVRDVKGGNTNLNLPLDNKVPVVPVETSVGKADTVRTGL